MTLELGHLGHRLRLRPLTENDWDLLLRWNADPDVVYFSEGCPDDLRPADEIKAIYREVSQTASCFIIEHDGLPIGECWLQEMNVKELTTAYPGRDCRRIDIMIGEKDYWNRGVGTAVIRRLVAFGFEEEDADLIFALPADYNPRSIRAFQKAGFREVGRRRTPPGSKGRRELHLAIEATRRHGA